MANYFIVNLKLSRSNDYGRAYIIRMHKLICFFMSIGPTPLVSSFHAPMQIDPMFIFASVSKGNFVSRTPSLFNAKLQVASARSAVLFDYSRPYQKVQLATFTCTSELTLATSRRSTHALKVNFAPVLEEVA